MTYVDHFPLPLGSGLQDFQPSPKGIAKQALTIPFFPSSLSCCFLFVMSLMITFHALHGLAIIQCSEPIVFSLWRFEGAYCLLYPSKSGLYMAWLPNY